MRDGRAIRVVIVGGSAPSTVNLLIDPRLAVDARVRFVLHGRSTRRLNAVRRAAATLAPQHGALDVTTDLHAALEGAELVIVQVRVGGFEARIHDETFPLEHGVPGDEGLGPGGLAAAWRSWPVIDAILRSVAQRAPHARVALLTAPLGILVRCALDAYPGLRIVGLCELPAVTLAEICSALAEPRVRYAYAGVNHLGWFFDVKAGDGRDLLEAYAATRTGATFPTRETVRRMSAVPLPYVRLHHARADALGAQLASPPRGQTLAKLAAAALRAFETGGQSEIRDALASRPAPWYAHAVAPWIAAHRDERSDETFFLTTRNAAYLSDIDDASVVEIPHRMRMGAFAPEKSPSGLPVPIARTLRALVGYETHAAAVVASRDGHSIPDVLATHPWVPDPTTAAALAEGVLARDFITPRVTGPA